MAKINKKILWFFIPLVVIIFVLWILFINVMDGFNPNFNLLTILTSGIIGIIIILLALKIGLKLEDEKKLKKYAVFCLIYGPVAFFVLLFILMFLLKIVFINYYL